MIAPSPFAGGFPGAAGTPGAPGAPGSPAGPPAPGYGAAQPGYGQEQGYGGCAAGIRPGAGLRPASGRRSPGYGAGVSVRRAASETPPQSKSRKPVIWILVGAGRHRSGGGRDRAVDLGGSSKKAGPVGRLQLHRARYVRHRHHHLHQRLGYTLNNGGTGGTYSANGKNITFNSGSLKGATSTFDSGIEDGHHQLPERGT